jgi:hypothetical protein
MYQTASYVACIFLSHVAMATQVENMMHEIATNGPIHACFDYYENFKDFFDYNPLGIYNSTDNSKYGGGHCVCLSYCMGAFHVVLFYGESVSLYDCFIRCATFTPGVTITGWGTDASSGLPYWLIRNRYSGIGPFHASLPYNLGLQTKYSSRSAYVQSHILTRTFYFCPC